VNTFYILGRKGFRQVALKNIGRKLRGVLPGEVIDHDDNHECQLFWLPDSIDLRDFKKSITSTVIFRYRLRFFHGADEYYLDKFQHDTTDFENTTDLVEMNPAKLMHT
jgi:hypothetical protein